MNNWILLLLQQLISSISPQLREAAVAFVKQLDEAAKKTDNPWDDIIVGILKTVLLIP